MVVALLFDINIFLFKYEYFFNAILKFNYNHCKEKHYKNIWPYTRHLCYWLSLPEEENNICACCCESDIVADSLECRRCCCGATVIIWSDPCATTETTGTAIEMGTPGPELTSGLPRHGDCVVVLETLLLQMYGVDTSCCEN